MATEMSEKMKALERENRELKHANEILRKKICIFCSGGARPSVQDMIAFIEENSNIGVKPICKHLPIAPSTFYDHMAKWANPRAAVGSGEAGYCLEARDRTRLGEELQGLGRSQGLASDAPRRL